MKNQQAFTMPIDPPHAFWFSISLQVSNWREPASILAGAVLLIFRRPVTRTPFQLDHHGFSRTKIGSLAVGCCGCVCKRYGLSRFDPHPGPSPSDPDRSAGATGTFAATADRCAA